MAILKYTMFENGVTPRDIYVAKGDSDTPYYLDVNRENREKDVRDVAAANVVTNGLIDSRINVYFGSSYFMSNSIPLSYGFKNPYVVYYSSDYMHLAAPNGRAIEIYSNDNSKPTIKYHILNRDSVTLYATGTDSSVGPGCYMFGLISDRIYTCHTRDGKTFSALLNPVFTGVDSFYAPGFNLGYMKGIAGINDDAVPANAEQWDIYHFGNLFPSAALLMNSDRTKYATSWDHSSSEGREKFERTVAFFSDFWNGIKDGYYAHMTIGAGGSVTPTAFFAGANEPRMFEVTPDQHHAIHSVKAYNTETNAEIPLQESAMDLLTGTKSYMFNMPSANVHIVVEFRSIEITIPVVVKYTSPRGKIFTTSFNLLYDDAREEEASGE